MRNLCSRIFLPYITTGEVNKTKTLDFVSLGWCVPGMMCPLDNASLTDGSCRPANLTQNHLLSWQVPRCSPGLGIIGQGRHVQGRSILVPHRPKGRINCPRDGMSVTFRLGTHCSGTHRHGTRLSILRHSGAWWAADEAVFGLRTSKHTSCKYWKRKKLLDEFLPDVNFQWIVSMSRQPSLVWEQDCNFPCQTIEQKAMQAQGRGGGGGSGQIAGHSTERKL